MFVLEYRYDEAKRTTFGSHFGAMRSMQGGHCHVATSPRRDVTKSRRHHVATSPSHDVWSTMWQKSTFHHVATSPRRDVTKSRRHHVATSPSHDVWSNTWQKSTFHHVATSPRRDVSSKICISSLNARRLRNLGHWRTCGQGHEI